MLRSRTVLNLLGATVWAAVGLAGCELQGEDGVQGPPGPPGPPGGVVIGDPEFLVAEIVEVRIAGKPEVEFAVYNEDGLPFTGVAPEWLQFTLAKLVPGTNGDASTWQSYINRVESPGGVGPATEDRIQATVDSGGILTNHGDGTYTYVFGTDVTNVTSPIAVTYDPTLTHRLGMSIGSREEGAPPAINLTYTWQPSTGRTTGIFTRDIVVTDSCNSCHGRLAAHGGIRVDTKYCVTCHNPGSADANSGHTVDFKVMIHKIHMGEELPSVQAGEPYQIYGFRNTLHDFSDIHYPQDIRNCTKCHDAANPETPDAGNWATRPTIQACGSCHDDIDFSAGIAGGHPGGVVTDNSECTVCHAEGRIAGSIESAHERPAYLASQHYRFNIISVQNTAPGQFPTIRFSVTDPLNDNAPYTFTEPEWTQSGSRLAVNLAWDTKDYRNEDTNRTPASAVSLNALAMKVANGDGTFTVTSTVAVPASVTGSGAVGIEGRAMADFDGDGTYSDAVPITGAVAYFPITDMVPVPRRSVVETARCQKCHGVAAGLVLHGSNRSDNVELCLMCHNSSNTDISQRPADPDATDDGVNLAAVDGLEERSVDFKTLIHGIHAADVREAPLIVYGFGGSVHDFSTVRFPGVLSNCETCHRPDTYLPWMPAGVMGTTVDTRTSLLDRADDSRVTWAAAACSSCHDSPLARRHMELNGAAFDTPQSFIDSGIYIETCTVCHGEGRTADVKRVHGIK